MNSEPVKMLLVEDNDDHVELTKRALRENGILNDIYVVKDGQEALDFLYHRGKYSDKTKAPRPGLILLDVKLPKIDGFEVLEKIKSDPDLKLIPVIMLTTSSRDEEIAKGYAGGANSYVTKPVDFNEFVNKIKSIRLYWVLVNKLPK
ncbi:MAG: response regulator [Desulfobacterales bacterium]|jgi:CheY-like chemotaxis protein|nr:response regulator [Desulfobacterales bacterium]